MLMMYPRPTKLREQQAAASNETTKNAASVGRSLIVLVAASRALRPRPLFLSYPCPSRLEHPSLPDLPSR